MMTLEELEKFRKKLYEDKKKMTDEERRRNSELSDLINKYEQKYEEGLAWEMPFTFEDLKEAYETDRPLHTWEKYKGYYLPVPDDYIL